MIKEIKYNRQVNNLISVLKTLQVEKFMGCDYYHFDKIPHYSLFDIDEGMITIRYNLFKKYQVTFGLSSLELSETIINFIGIGNCNVGIFGDGVMVDYSVTDYKFELY